MNRITLTSELVDVESFQAKALGLVQEVVLRVGKPDIEQDLDAVVLCCDHPSLIDGVVRALVGVRKHQYRAVCISSRCLSDARVVRELKRVRSRHEVPLMIEISSADLLLLDDDQEFELLNQCEELSAFVHLELDDYRDNWSHQLQRALVRLSGFVGSLGLPVPQVNSGISEVELNKIESDLDELLTSVSRNFDISTLSFRNYRVGATGTIEPLRFWHGL